LLNGFRNNPKSLANHLRTLLRYLNKTTNILTQPDRVPIQMEEGEALFKEAIDYLMKLKPLNSLEWDDNLALAAMEHVLDIGPKGLLSYQSSDGTDTEDRVNKYGTFDELLGENIDFGPNDSMGVIVSLTLDDGETDRPHRNNLFNPDYNKIGIACGPHQTEYELCVMDFADHFEEIAENEQEPELENKSNSDQNGNKQIKYISDDEGKGNMLNSNSTANFSNNYGVNPNNSKKENSNKEY
jgi:uncharacterized protein YkwD